MMYSDVALFVYPPRRASLMATSLILASAVSLLTSAVSVAWAGSEVQERLENGGVYDVKQVVSAWQKHGKEIRAASVRFTENRITSKDAFIKPPQGKTLDAMTERFPKEDSTTQMDCWLLFDGANIRIEKQGFSPSPQGITESRHMASFDGHASKVLYASKNPFGVIQPADERGLGIWQDMAALPVFYALLPAKTSRLDTLRNVVISKEPNSNSLLHVIADSPGSPGGQMELWLDAAHKFRIYRVAVKSHGLRSIEHAIEFKNDALHDWMPTSWRSTAYHPGTDKSMVTAASQVTMTELNPVLAKGSFDLQFPENIVVTDMRDGTDFIQRPGGERRVITANELRAGVTRERLIQTESGKALEVLIDPSSRPWILIANVLVIITLTILLLRRRTRRTSV